MPSSNTLYLTLKKEWFDLIVSGEKKEEYRDVKDFWITRLYDREGDIFYPKPFTKVQFRNGYSPTSPVVVLQCKGIRMAYGKQKWGAEKGIKYLVIDLGKILKKPQKR